MYTVRAERYLPEDYEQLKVWYAARGLDAPSAEAIPKTGIIIPGIAIGFLLRTDGPIALIWGLVSNPAVDQGTREKAVELVVDRLESLARNSGFIQIVGLTVQEKVLGYARKKKYQQGGRVSLVVKELR